MANIDPKIRAIYYSMLKKDPTDVWKSDREAYNEAYRAFVYSLIEPTNMITTILEQLVDGVWWE